MLRQFFSIGLLFSAGVAFGLLITPVCIDMGGRLLQPENAGPSRQKPRPDMTGKGLLGQAVGPAAKC